MPNLTATYGFNQPFVNDARDADIWGDLLNNNTQGYENEIGAPFVSIASGATVDIGQAASRNVEITGSVTITSFGTVNAGYTRRVRFTGAPIITHNASSLILPSGANIQAAANDTLLAVSLGSGNWVVTSYMKASGLAVSTPLATTSDAGIVQKADQAAMEGQTADRYPDAANLQYHPLVPKGWAVCNGLSGGILESKGNISSFTRNSTGSYSVLLSPAFTTANYCIQLTTDDNNSNGNVLRVVNGTVAVNTFDISSRLNTSAPSQRDCNRIMITVLGDL